MLPTTLGKATSNDIFTNHFNFLYKLWTALKVIWVNSQCNNLSNRQGRFFSDTLVLWVDWLLLDICKERSLWFIILIVIFLILIGIISCAACRGDFLLIAPGHWSMLTQWPLQSAISGMVMIMMMTRLSWMVSDEGVRRSASKRLEKSTCGPYFSVLACNLIWGTNFSFWVPAVSCSFSHCSFSVSKTLGINQRTFVVHFESH